MSNRNRKSTAKREFSVYVFTFPNGKRYVGKTNDTHGRWETHRRLAERLAELKTAIKRGKTLSKNDEKFFRLNNKPFYNAIIKYGWSNICKEKRSGFTEAGAFKEEKRLIRTLKTRTKYGKGYNLTDGGDGMSGYEWTEESRAKMRKPKSPEARAKMSAAHTGKTLSPEHCANMSATVGKHRDENIFDAMQMLLDGHSTNEVAEYYEVAPGTILAWREHAKELGIVVKPTATEYRDENIVKAMQMLKDGYKQDEVAEYYEVRPATVAGWRRYAEKHGLVSASEVAAINASKSANQSVARRKYRDENIHDMMQMLLDGYKQYEIAAYYEVCIQTITSWKKHAKEIGII